MKTFLVNSQTNYGDNIFFVKSEHDLTLHIWDGEYPTKEEQLILDKLDIKFTPEDHADMVDIYEVDVENIEEIEL